MTVDLYTAIIDTGIFILLLIWSYMDRNQIYLDKKEEE